MELQQSEVSHRLSELRGLARSLRFERGRRRHPRGLLGPLQIALGRRLVALGLRLLDRGGISSPGGPSLASARGR